MTRRFRRLSLPASGAVAIAVALAIVAAPAAPGRAEPLPQRQISRGAVSVAHPTAAPRPVHFVYGTLVAVRGSALTMRARDGTLLSVDAASAIAAGTYSAPLFAGKTVVLGGWYAAPRTFHAQTVTRIPRLDASTGPDR